MTWCESSPTISKVKKVARGKEYILTLSDGSTLRALEDHLTRFGLEEGRSIGEDTLQEIAASYEYAKVRQSAYRLLKTRPRTEQELRRRFRKQGFDSKVSERVLNDLALEGLVDDRTFAQLWIRERIGRADSGRRRIRSDLLARGIDKAIVEAELAVHYDDSREIDVARDLALKRLRRMKDLAPEAQRRRIHNLLLRRGFDPDVARQVFEDALKAIDGQ
jgi:regulatory protein